MKIVISILGILVVMAIMYLLSASKKDVPLKTDIKSIMNTIYNSFYAS